MPHRRHRGHRRGGKTQLALEYVLRFGRRRFPDGIFWLDAEKGLEEQHHGILQVLSPASVPDGSAPVASGVHLKLWWVLGAGQGKRPGREVEVVEDAGGDGGTEDADHYAGRARRLGEGTTR